MQVHRSPCGTAWPHELTHLPTPASASVAGRPVGQPVQLLQRPRRRAQDHARGQRLRPAALQ
eukprot:364843-Chlamydomonas_euryale.AAC.1